MGQRQTDAFRVRWLSDSEKPSYSVSNVKDRCGGGETIMLTEAARRERKWGPFPSLRLVLEDKAIPDNYYGVSSVSDTMFDEINRLVEITILVREHESEIKEIAKSLGPAKLYQDLDLLQRRLDALSSFFKEHSQNLRGVCSRL